MRPEALEKVLNNDFLLSSDVLWFVLTLAIIVVFISSLVLFFHWNKYGRDTLAVGFAEVIYLAGIVFFLLGSAASIMLF